MILEQIKQLDDLVLSEVNIKELVRIIGATEKGNVELVYNGEEREYSIVNGWG